MAQHDVGNWPDTQFASEWKIPADTTGAGDAIPMNGNINAGIADGPNKTRVVSINCKSAFKIKWHISTKAISAAQRNHLQVRIAAAAVCNV